jgi:hypothetical protein
MRPPVGEIVHEKSVRPFPAVQTDPAIDTRAAPRYTCRARPLLLVGVRPRREPFHVSVKDISVQGAGLLCSEPIEAGSVLSIRWAFGTEESRRTVRAKVIRLAPLLHGGWVLGCVFKERLRQEDLEAFIRHDEERADSHHG